MISWPETEDGERGHRVSAPLLRMLGALVALPPGREYPAGSGSSWDEPTDVERSLTGQEITVLLEAARSGDEGALDRAFPLVYDELRRLASMVRSGRAGETLNATALVHEAYLKLFRSTGLSWNDRSHFFRLAARAMRQVLMDEAERSAAAKRGGGVLDVTLFEGIADRTRLQAAELIDLDRALTELGEDSPRCVDVVECRFFAGMSAEETAEALELSPSTVTRDWRFARAWLTDRLAR